MADRSVAAAELTAAVAVLEYFASQPAPHGASPVLLRFSSESASSLFAGTYDPPTLRRLRGEAAGRLSAERARRGALRNVGLPACGIWVVGWWPLSRQVWGERSVALAQHGRSGCWGPVPAPLDAAPPAVAPPAASCPMCYEDYEDPFPHPATCAPTPRERWSCASLRHAHVVCRDCDALVQSSANTTCPLCRAPRLLFVQGDSQRSARSPVSPVCMHATRLLCACFSPASRLLLGCFRGTSVH